MSRLSTYCCDLCGRRTQVGEDDPQPSDWQAAGIFHVCGDCTKAMSDALEQTIYCLRNDAHDLGRMPPARHRLSASSGMIADCLQILAPDLELGVHGEAPSKDEEAT